MPKTKVAILRKQAFRIIAQDPAVRTNGRILTAQVDVPAEELAAGPWGHRVQVIDCDASTQRLYRPLNYPYRPELWPHHHGPFVTSFALGSADFSPDGLRVVLSRPPATPTIGG